jgi:hypothetical protein
MDFAGLSEKIIAVEYAAVIGVALLFLAQAFYL